MKRIWFKCFFASVAVVLLFSSIAHAQSMLRLEDAIKIGLEKNYDILIVANDASVDANNATLGNAGFLPTITATGGRSQRIEDSETRFSDANVSNRIGNNVITDFHNANVLLDWTLYDGGRMFAAYGRLSATRDIGKTEYRLQVENTVAEIITTYANVVGQRNAVRVLENTVEVSEERIEIAATKLDLGSGSEFDLLQAQSDLIADQAALLRSKNALSTTKIMLNQLMGRAPEIDFLVEDSLNIEVGLQFSDLLNNLENQNTQLALARQNIRIAELESKEISAERFPEIGVNLSYLYTKTEGGANLLDFNRTDGWNYGIIARINIFDGFNLNRRKENAKINIKTSQLALEQTQLSVSSALLTVYSNYQNALELMELERQNLSISNRTLDIALERFRLGSIDSIELREAQLTQINAESRLIIAQVEAKTAEIELLRLSGMITPD